VSVLSCDAVVVLVVAGSGTRAVATACGCGRAPTGTVAAGRRAAWWAGAVERSPMTPASIVTSSAAPTRILVSLMPIG